MWKTPSPRPHSPCDIVRGCKNIMVQKLFQIEVWSFGVQSKSKSTAIPPSSIVLATFYWTFGGLEVEKTGPPASQHLQTFDEINLRVRNHELYASYKTMPFKGRLRNLGGNGDCSAQKDFCYFLLDFWRRVD